MDQSQNLPRDGYTAVWGVEDNRYVVPIFYKWVCMKCGWCDNEMENIECSRCQVERVFGTLAGEYHPGPLGSIVWMIRDKDYHGNEN